MRVLITNNTLAERAGTDLYVRDVAIGLLRRGHQPVAFSTRLGDVAEELRAATVPVISDLDQLSAVPDVIHGHHHVDAMTAMLHFPSTPALYFCHGWQPWEELAPHFPSIRKYIAVDDLCRERLQAEGGIGAEQICVIRNFVDLNRFLPRQRLPDRPARALVFSNQARHDGYAAIVADVCAARGVALDVVGSAAGNISRHPEQVLGDYDVVFAKARAALEALAVGTAVIACDASGLAELVTPDNYERLRRLNFGVRSLSSTITADNIARELARYDAQQAQDVSRRVRAEAGLEQALDQLLAVYGDAIHRERSAPHDPARDLANQLKAASRYLWAVGGVIKAREETAAARTVRADRETALRVALETRDGLRAERDALRESLTQAQDRLARREGELQAVLETCDGLRAERDALGGSLTEAQHRLARREGELQAIYRSRLWAIARLLFRAKHVLWTRPFGRARVPSERAQAFDLIFRENRWFSDETPSGRGSTLPYTQVLRGELPGLLARFKVRRLVDAACGDCNWRQHVTLDLDEYVGVDIVPALIEENRRRFAHTNWIFKTLDVVDDSLPSGDAVLCRDCLSHLPLDDIRKALENFRRSGAKYLLATSHEQTDINVDIPAGGWRALNLLRPPFTLPEPLAQIDENPRTGKILGVWAL